MEQQQQLQLIRVSLLSAVSDCLCCSAAATSLQLPVPRLRFSTTRNIMSERVIPVMHGRKGYKAGQPQKPKDVMKETQEVAPAAKAKAAAAAASPPSNGSDAGSSSEFEEEVQGKEQQQQQPKEEKQLQKEQAAKPGQTDSSSSSAAKPRASKRIADKLAKAKGQCRGTRVCTASELLLIVCCCCSVSCALFAG